MALAVRSMTTPNSAATPLGAIAPFRLRQTYGSPASTGTISANRGERQAHQDQQGFINPAECQVQRVKMIHIALVNHQLQFLVCVAKQFKLSGE